MDLEARIASLQHLSLHGSSRYSWVKELAQLHTTSGLLDIFLEEYHAKWSTCTPYVCSA